MDDGYKVNFGKSCPLSSCYFNLYQKQIQWQNTNEQLKSKKYETYSEIQNTLSVAFKST